MTAPRGDQIVEGYLAEVDVALGDLPAAQRAQVAAQVRDRIARARAALVDESDQDVFRLLDQIGDPAAVAARSRAGLPPLPRTGWLEVLAIAGLVLVWPVGVVLLWCSRVWSRRAKLIGTLVPPGGPAVPVIALWVALHHTYVLPCTDVYTNDRLTSSNCSPFETALTLMFSILFGAIWVWYILTIVTAIFLAARAWQSVDRPRPAPSVPPAGDNRPSRGIFLRLALILTVLAALVVAELVVSDGVGLVMSGGPGSQSGTGQPNREAAAGGQATPSAPASASASSAPSGSYPLPGLTPAQFVGAFRARGYSCIQPRALIGTWLTACTQVSGTVAALGSDDHTIDMVNVNLAGAGQGGNRAGATQLTDAVIQSVCRPEDVGQVTAWVHDHLEAAGQTDIDGYQITVNGLGKNVVMSIARSRP